MGEVLRVDNTGTQRLGYLNQKKKGFVFLLCYYLLSFHFEFFAVLDPSSLDRLFPVNNRPLRLRCTVARISPHSFEIS